MLFVHRLYILKIMNFSQLLALDQNFAVWINQTCSNIIFDIFFPIYTDLHKNIYIALSLICLILYSFIRKYKKFGGIHFLFLLLALGTNDFIGSFIKNRVDRQRPFANSQLLITQRSAANPNKSFYSNHASNTFTAAYFVGQLFPQGKIIYFGLAGLVAFSRVYNGVHYPSDVIAGAFVGLLMGFIFIRLSQKTFHYAYRKNYP